MKINEIKKEVTEVKVIRTEYIADDGTVFYNEEECKKYEESAKFAVLSELKLLQRCTQYDLDDDKSDEYEVEIFDIQTERDLEMFRRYLLIKLSENGAAEKDIDYMFNNERGINKRVTFGHEVIVQWSYDMDSCWIIGDGSIDAYVNYFRDRITKLITPKNQENTNA